MGYAVLVQMLSLMGYAVLVQNVVINALCCVSTKCGH